MKRILLVIASGFLALTLTACGETQKGSDKPAGDATNQVQQTQEEKNNAVKQSDDHTKKEIKSGEEKSSGETNTKGTSQ